MKITKVLCSVLAALTLVSASFISASAADENSNADIKKATVAPVIDGKIDKIWSYAPEIKPTQSGDNPTEGLKDKSYFKMLWDDKGFYVLAYVADTTVNPDVAGDAWKHVANGLELYVSETDAKEWDPAKAYKANGAGGTGDYIVRLASDGNGIITSDLLPADKVSFKTVVNKGKDYIVEVFIPWNKTDAKHEVGSKMGITFKIRDDTTGNGEENGWAMWDTLPDGNGQHRYWDMTYCIPTVTLVAGPEITPEPPATADTLSIVLVVAAASAAAVFAASKKRG